MTIESFLAWKAEFDEERLAKLDKKEREKKKSDKLNGKNGVDLVLFFIYKVSIKEGIIEFFLHVYKETRISLPKPYIFLEDKGSRPPPLNGHVR